MTLRILKRKIITFCKIDTSTKLRFIQAFIYEGIARAYILFVPFNKLRKMMGKHKEESPNEVSIEHIKVARQIGQSVILAARHTPWESKCLVQALAAQWMMNRKGIATTLYLGVKKDSNNNMLAHAWIRCGSYYITGGYNKEGYAVVAKFKVP